MSERKAFVIMPFGEAFDEVYNLFIADTLTAAGYLVVRADNIRAQQNILKDIVVSIAGAHLVVADLTDSNANVYYELGIAHALRRPVILLTQQLEELPFDLRSYRVIPYSTHFGEIKRAREALLDLAKGAAEGTVPFGNPVLDFLGTSSGIPNLPGEPSAEAGLLDYLVGVEDSLSFLTRVTAEYLRGNDQDRAYYRRNHAAFASCRRERLCAGCTYRNYGTCSKLIAVRRQCGGPKQSLHSPT